MNPRMRSLIQAVLLLPGMAAGVIPLILIFLTQSFNPAWNQAFPRNLLLGLSGGFLAACGFGFAAATVRLFFTQGEGTPAPWDPPKKLVIAGPYRYVRNPMISSVLMILAGEALLFGSWAIACLLAFFFIVNHFYFIYFEEPSLVKRFGQDYENYKRRVPRWIPKLKPYP